MSLTPANVSAGTRVSTGTHSQPASMLAWCSYSAWRPFSPVSHFVWCSRFDWHPYQHDTHVSLDDHVHLMATFRLTLMLTWYSCFTRYSREIAATHTVHGPRELPHGKNRAACMISRLPTRNRAFAGKILTLCIPNSLIASENAYMEQESCHR